MCDRHRCATTLLLYQTQGYWCYLQRCRVVHVISLPSCDQASYSQTEPHCAQLTVPSRCKNNRPEHWPISGTNTGQGTGFGGRRSPMAARSSLPCSATTSCFSCAMSESRCVAQGSKCTRRAASVVGCVVVTCPKPASLCTALTHLANTAVVPLAG